MVAAGGDPVEPAVHLNRPERAMIVCAGPLWALGLALGALFSPHDTVHVVSTSMNPTLIEGDHLLVDTLAYNVSAMPFEGGLSRYLPRRPVGKAHYGDIVLFQPDIEPKMLYVKRVVGLAGDRIAFDNGQLIINGQATPLMARIPRSGHGRQELWQEVLPNGRRHAIRIDADARRITFAEQSVPQGHYFVMGDNRGHSLDSRFAAIGFVPQAALHGRAVLRYGSVRSGAQLWQFWRWPHILRMERAFSPLDPAQ